MTIFTNLITIIKESTDPGSKYSSSRLQAYFVLFTTILYSFTFVVIEISNATMSLTTGVPYAPSNESIVVLGMLLSHHLGLMFSKRSDSPSVIVPVGLHSSSTTTTTSSSSTIEPAPDVVADDSVVVAVTTAVVKPKPSQTTVKTAATPEDDNLADQI